MLQKITSGMMVLMMMPAMAYAGEWSGQQPVGVRCLTAGIPQIFVNFTAAPKDVDGAEPEFQRKLGEIDALAATLGVGKLKAQAVNYTITPQTVGWQVNGSAAFDAPTKHCKELLAVLKQNGFGTGMNPLADAPGVCQ